MNFLPHNHIRLCPVYADRNADNPLCLRFSLFQPQFRQLFHQLLRRRKLSRVNYQTDHNLSGGKPGANQHMAHQSGSLLFTVSAHMILPHKRKNRFQNYLIFRRPKRTFRVRNDVMRPARIKAGDQITVFIISHRILRFIAVMPGLLHPDDRLHDRVNPLRRKPADPNQVSPHFILFIFQLLVIMHGLNLAAPALPVKRAFRLHTKRRRRRHLLYSRVSVIFFAFRDSCLDDIADHGILYKQGITFRPADPLAVISDIFNADCNHVIFLKASIFHKQNPLTQGPSNEDLTQTIC